MSQLIDTTPSAVKPALIHIRHAGRLYLLEDRSSEVTTDLNAGAWRGILTFAFYAVITDNDAFQQVMDALFRSGFEGRIVGKPLMLHGVSIKRFTRAEQEAQDGAAGIVRIEYTALRLSTKAVARETVEGFEIVTVSLP
jgi:hypothetical protein